MKKERDGCSNVEREDERNRWILVVRETKRRKQRPLPPGLC